ncbi:MAG: restriction endonuclease subunit S [Prevotella sp.]|nr:restriction endonuclease subunit S [Prevotella sp.]
MESNKYKLSQLLTIKNGKDYKHLEQGNIPVFGSGGYMCSVSSYLYDKTSILLPRKGTLSNIQFYNNGKFWTVDTCFYSIINETLCDPYYLYRYLRSLDLSGYDTGASIPSMTQKTYNGIKVILPSINIQNRIASILSAYDNLIENNNKRICLLEQMAENLYKEWFSYHRIKPISSEIRLTDIVSITRGLSYSSEEIDCVEGSDLINLKNIQAYGGFRLDGTKKYCGKHKKEQVVIEGDLIMGVTDMTQDRRTVGSVALIPNTFNLSVISADLIKLTSTIDNVFLYAMFRWGGVSKYISQFANGANVLHLRPQALKNVKILLPSNVFIDKYVSIVKPMIATINKLNTENEQLSRQRDLLLPRLMSGKLEVNEP